MTPLWVCPEGRAPAEPAHDSHYQAASSTQPEPRGGGGAALAPLAPTVRQKICLNVMMLVDVCL